MTHSLKLCLVVLRMHYNWSRTWLQRTRNREHGI